MHITNVNNFAISIFLFYVCTTTHRKANIKSIRIFEYVPDLVDV